MMDVLINYPLRVLHFSNNLFSIHVQYKCLCCVIAAIPLLSSMLKGNKVSIYFTYNFIFSHLSPTPLAEPSKISR